MKALHEQQAADEAKRLASLPPELAGLIEPRDLRQRLRREVRAFAALVDADWHDGMDEQSEALYAWAMRQEKLLRRVMKLVLRKRTRAVFERANDILVELADSWEHVLVVPLRGELHEEYVGEAELCLLDCGAGDDEYLSSMSRYEAVQAVWLTLLYAAAAAPKDVVSDALLLRFVKDCTDFGYYCP